MCRCHSIHCLLYHLSVVWILRYAVIQFHFDCHCCLAMAISAFCAKGRELIENRFLSICLKCAPKRQMPYRYENVQNHRDFLNFVGFVNDSAWLRTTLCPFIDTAIGLARSNKDSTPSPFPHPFVHPSLIARCSWAAERTHTNANRKFLIRYCNSKHQIKPH